MKQVLILLGGNENQHPGFCGNLWHFPTKQEWDSKYFKVFEITSDTNTYMEWYLYGFYSGTPEGGKKYMIMVLVNFLSKYAHFCALPHPFTPSLVSQVLLYHIFKLHGISTFIVSDGDPTFTRKFWQYLFKIHRS